MVVKARVRQATLDEMARVLRSPGATEGTVSQLLRRYIAEGLAVDQARAARRV